VAGTARSGPQLCGVIVTYACTTFAKDVVET